MKELQRFFWIGFFLLVHLICSGQNSLDFRQFYFNPYLFNPAYAGVSGYTEAAIAHRQQWIGFEDSPVVSGFSFQDPLKKRVFIGFNLSTQKSIALRNTSVLATVGYAIPITENHSLRFAFSGGMTINDVDLEGRDYSNDPLILAAAQNKVYGEGSFGMLYTIKEFAVGIALPTLFSQQGTGAGILKTHPLEHLLNQLYSVRYKFNVKSGFAVEPYFLYRLNRDLQNYWEVASLIHYKEKISVGASYQQYNGLAFFMGYTFREDYSIGYGYEVPNRTSAKANSHEFQMKFRFGEKKEIKPREKIQ